MNQNNEGSEMQEESFAIVEHNGVAFPLVTEPRCRVCSDPDRLFIEDSWVRGIKPKRIIQSLTDSELNDRNISDHFRAGHVPTARNAVVALMEQRAEEQGVTVEEYERNKTRELFTAEMVVDKFRARLVDDDFQPDFKDGMAAIKLLHELTAGTRSEGFGVNEMFVTLSTFLAHVRTVLTRYVPAEAEAAMEALGTLIDQDPVIRQLISVTKTEQYGSMLDEEEDDAYYTDSEDEPVDNIEVGHVEYEGQDDEDEPFDELED